MRKSKQPKQKKKKSPGKIIAIIMLLIIILGATGVFSFNFFISDRLTPVGEGDAVIIEITEGSVINDIAAQLVHENLIQDALAFELLAKKQGNADLIQTGYYQFSPGESASEILNRLIAGDIYNTSVTIPEGRNIKEFATILEEHKVCSAEAFIAETKKVAEYQKEYPILSSITLDAKDGITRTLEGYLFPDTYNFHPNSEPSEVVTAMLNRFVEVYTPEYLNRTTEMGKTVDQIVIMGSIIELETKFDEDKANAASVFYNRLAVDQPLQSDITVDYARGDKTAILTTEETQFPSPYNTYINPGLPFGPICSFGEPALKAALYPAETNFMYFVADISTGKIYFNETYEEHLADVETYLGSSN
ncbi:MAG: endolytic transglycosylase MltG [Acetobacterium sp.]